MKVAEAKAILNSIANNTIGKYAKALDEAIRTLDKQIPQRPGYDKKLKVYYCPVCEGLLSWNEPPTYDSQYYCNKCGQRLE